MMPTQNELERLAGAINILPDEQWRPVVGFELTYAVSSQGRVYSHPRPRTSGGLLRQSIDNHGYPRVGLVQGGKQSTRRVHQLMMVAFLGPAPEGMEVRHLDGDRRNCNLENLTYGTHAENMADTIRHGTTNSAKTHCPRSHAYDAANTARRDGKRYCLACRKIRNAA